MENQLTLHQFVTIMVSRSKLGNMKNEHTTIVAIILNERKVDFLYRFLPSHHLAPFQGRQ
jgi:hypothetical protein